MRSVIEDLAEFLKARLDEDEALIRRNSDGHGLCDGFPDYRTYADGESNAADEYIEHFGPARMSREVEAKRKRLALYLDAKETLAAALKNAPPEDDPATAHSYVRERINVNQASGRFTALEMSVRLDATAYDDHPDCRQEWARETA